MKGKWGFLWVMRGGFPPAAAAISQVGPDCCMQFFCCMQFRFVACNFPALENLEKMEYPLSPHTLPK